MAERKPFLLRLDPVTHAALQRWANDDLRSVNGQVEFLLRRALAEAGRLPGASSTATPTTAAAAVASAVSAAEATPGQAPRDGEHQAADGGVQDPPGHGA